MEQKAPVALERQRHFDAIPTPPRPIPTDPDVLLTGAIHFVTHSHEYPEIKHAIDFWELHGLSLGNDNDWDVFDGLSEADHSEAVVRQIIEALSQKEVVQFGEVNYYPLARHLETEGSWDVSQDVFDQLKTGLSESLSAAHCEAVSLWVGRHDILRDHELGNWYLIDGKVAQITEINPSTGTALFSFPDKGDQILDSAALHTGTWANLEVICKNKIVQLAPTDPRVLVSIEAQDNEQPFSKFDRLSVEQKMARLKNSLNAAEPQLYVVMDRRQELPASADCGIDGYYWLDSNRDVVSDDKVVKMLDEATCKGEDTFFALDEGKLRYGS